MYTQLKSCFSGVSVSMEANVKLMVSVIVHLVGSLTTVNFLAPKEDLEKCAIRYVMDIVMEIQLVIKQLVCLHVPKASRDISVRKHVQKVATGKTVHTIVNATKIILYIVGRIQESAFVNLDGRVKGMYLFIFQSTLVLSFNHIVGDVTIWFQFAY